MDSSIFDPVSPQAESIRYLAFLILAITGGIFLIVEGVLLYSLWRFRQARSSDASEPPQVYGSKPIEIAWTAAPALIVFVLTLVIARTEWEVRASPIHLPPELQDAQKLGVTVVGHQWWWECQYDRYGDETLGFITANELHVPASDFRTAKERRPVFLTLRSADVAHSFWVPRLAGKTDLIPGKTTSAWFETDRPGLYVGQCAEYCGTQHANMLLRVYVDSPQDFRRWLDREKQDAQDRDDAEIRAGKKAFLAQSCINCHRVRGTPARGVFGPDLTHLMNRATLAAGVLDNDRAGSNLRKWISDPQSIKSGCLMPAFGTLNESDLKGIVRYLTSLE